MSNSSGKVVLINHEGRQRNAEQQDGLRYNIVTVHGIGNIGVQNVDWTRNRKGVSWLTDFLPIHACCGSMMAFEYSFKDIHDGISIDVIRDLAMQLLDQLCELLDTNRASYTVFVAQDIGGLIVKEALVSAIGNSKYASIAGRTSLLVFFGTPHRAADSTPWEDVASWLVYVSGERKYYNVQWVLGTSQMLKSVHDSFRPIENTYNVISLFYQQASQSLEVLTDHSTFQALDAESATLGAPKEVNIGRDTSHANMTRFSNDENKALVDIYKELRVSRGPGSAYIKCLTSLAKLFNQFNQTFTILELGTQDSGALKGLQDRELYRSWLKGDNAFLCIRGSLGTDSPKLLAQAKHSDNTLAISLKCGSRIQSHSGPVALFAALCHQVLCFRPHIFDYVSQLYDLYSKDQGWQKNSLQVFLCSLLCCPYEGHTVCLIEDLHEINNYEDLLDDLVVLATSEVQNFKLIVTIRSEPIRGEALQHQGNIIAIDQVQACLDSIVHFEVCNLISKRPGLSTISDTLERILHSKFDTNAEVKALSGNYLSCMIKVYLTIIVSLSEPITMSSVEKAALLPVNGPDGLFEKFLASIAPQHRQLSRYILSWLARAFRPLRLDELAVVAAFLSDKEPHEGLKDEIPVDLAHDLKTNFDDLILEDGEQAVRLHEYLQDYVLRQPSYGGRSATWPSFDDHLHIARTCLEYILFYTPQESGDSKPTTGCYHGFLLYAVRHWADHYKQGKTEMLKSPNFDDLFGNPALIHRWARMYFESQPPGMHCNSGHPLCISVEVGCHDLVKALLKDSSHSTSVLTSALETAVMIGDESLVGQISASGAVSRQAMHIAAGAGHTRLVQSLYKTKDGLLSENPDGLTPLHCACKGGQISTVRALLTLGSPVNIKSSAEKRSPLHLACEFGHVKVTNHLLEKGANPNEVDHSGLTPLHVACIRQQARSASALFRSDKTAQSIRLCSKQSSTMHFAAKSGRIDILKLLIQHSGPDDLRELMQMGDNEGMRPLHIAAAEGHPEMIRELLQLDTDLVAGTVLEKDEQSYIPLHLAIKSGRQGAVQPFLDCKNTLSDQIWSRVRNTSGAYPIHLAVECNNHVAVKLLCNVQMEDDIPINVFDHDNSRSPLHIAAQRGQIDIIKLLLDNGATTNILDWDDATPLHTASAKGHLEAVKLLLEKGADPDAEDDDHRTPVVAALEGGHDEIASLLVEKSNLGNLALLMTAPRGGHTSFVAKLLQKIPNLDMEHEEMTPLMMAGEQGHLDLVKLFLSAGASPTFSNAKGCSPLDVADVEEIADGLLDWINFEEMENTKETLENALRHAARSGFTNLIRRLKELGTNMAALDSNRQSLYHLAAQGGQQEVIKLLLEFGVHGYDSVDLSGRSPLSHASEKGHFNVVEFLLENKLLSIDVNKADGKGQTSLWFATVANDPSIVRILLKHGADPNIAASDSLETPLHRAVMYDLEEILDILLEFDASATKQTKSGRSALFLAAFWGRTHIVLELLNRQVADIPDEDGWRALHAAYDSPEIIELLLTKGGANIHAITNDSSTVLHLAAGGQEEATRVLLNHGADPLRPAADGITPLHIAARSCDNEELFNLMLEKAAGRVDVKDNGGGTPFTRAIENDNATTVKLLMDTGTISVNEADSLEEFVLDLALENLASNVLVLALSSRNSSFPIEKIEKVLLWAFDNNWETAEQKVLAILSARDPTLQTEYNRLLELADGSGDDNLDGSPRPERPDSGVRDQHGWTLRQLLRSFDLAASIQNSVLSPDEKHRLPSRWSVPYSSKELAFTNDNGLHIRATRPSMRIRARSDHPIPSTKRFYFEITVIEEGPAQIVGVGFSSNHRSTTDMPGWDPNTWGFHGDDGGFFHAGGWSKKSHDDWRYGKGDCIGCIIDSTRGEAFFTRNGTTVGPCFKNVRGRLFPLVGFEPGVELTANFGGNLESEPFKYPTSLSGNYEQGSHPKLYIQ